MCSERGEGVAQNLDLVFESYSKAAAQNHANARIAACNLRYCCAKSPREGALRFSRLQSDKAYFKHAPYCSKHPATPGALPNAEGRRGLEAVAIGPVGAAANRAS